jgi:uncharacterized membrane protein YdjX (TVP38/TMEM64 family)
LDSKYRTDYSLITNAFAPAYRRAAIVLLVVLILAVLLVLATGWHRHLSLEAVVDYRERLEALVAGRRFKALAIYVALYACAAGLSLPGVAILTMGGGVVFGGLLGGAAAVIGATLGATAVFLLVKTGLRDLVRRWAGPQAERFAAGFRKDAFSYLLFMRIVPIFPFSMGNLLPALCGVSLGTFVAATLLGIIPMTAVFALLGASLDETLAAEIAEYRACLAGSGSACRIGFNFSTVLTPELLAAIAFLAVAALAPMAIRRMTARRE